MLRRGCVLIRVSVKHKISGCNLRKSKNSVRRSKFFCKERILMCISIRVSFLELSSGLESSE